MASSESGSPTARRGRPDLDDSYREFRAPLLVLALTTGAAGFLDAFAFLRYGVFVANQSGNVLFLGIGLTGRQSTWPAAAASLATFAAGAGVVTLLRSIGGRPSPALRSLAATVLSTAAWAGANALLQYGRSGAHTRIVLSALGGLAMGALATLFVRTAGVATTITYQSGTVTKTGEQMVAWIAGPGKDRARSRRASLLGLLTLAAYAAGGALGALAQQQPRWAPVWATLVLTTVALALRPAPRQGD